MKIIMEDPVTGHRTSTYIDPLKIAPYRQEVPSTEGKFLLSNKNKQDQQDQHEQKSQQSQTSNGSNVVDDDGDDGDDANDDGSGSANATLTSNVDDNDYTIIWSQLSNENENYTDTATKNNNGNDNDVMTNKNGENGGFVNKYRRSISMTISSAHHRTLRNFWLMSILFGLNQACVNGTSFPPPFIPTPTRWNLVFYPLPSKVDFNLFYPHIFFFLLLLLHFTHLKKKKTILVCFFFLSFF